MRVCFRIVCVWLRVCECARRKHGQHQYVLTRAKNSAGVTTGEELKIEVMLAILHRRAHKHHLVHLALR